MILYTTYALAQTVGTTTSSDYPTTITESTSSTTVQEATSAAASTKDEVVLSGSETSNPKPPEIVKQIRRVNADGSYTFGYEAEDGTFKIESRDVLGNVKGTFGFIDDAGEIKRVSYSANNQSSIKSTPIPKEEPPQILLPRVNRTAVLLGTTRRPHTSLVYSHVTTTPLPTRQTVIQAIPRRRLPNLVGSSSTTASPDGLRPIYTHYATSKDSTTISTTPSIRDRPIGSIYSSTPTSNPRPVVIVRPTTQVSIQKPITEGQLDRPDDAESTTLKIENLPTPTRRTHITRRPTEKGIEISSTQKPVYEVLSKKSEDEVSKKSVRGNSLRRQLNQDRDVQYEAQEQVLNYQQSSGDDSTDIYGGSITTGNPRLLFTTTASPPRILPAVLANRHRQYGHFSSPQSTSTVREYVRQPQRLPVEPTIDPTTETTNSLTENPVPVLQLPVSNSQYINLARHQQHRPLPISSINQFRTREYLREHPGAPVPIGNQRPEYRVSPDMMPDERGQYLRETSSPNLIRAATQGQYQAEDSTPNTFRGGPLRRPDERIPYMHNAVTPYPDYQPYHPDYRTAPYQYPNDDFNNIGMPLTTRDFQRLLQQIINKHRFGQSYNPYYSSQGYPQFGGYPRPFYNGPNGPVPFDPQQNRPYPMYRQVPTRQQLLEQETYGNSMTEAPFDHRFAPRRRTPYRSLALPYTQDPQDSYDQHNVFLPPEVREALLLRMLMLALTPDGPMPSPSNNDVTTTAPAYMKKKPVRSVQILGEDPPARTKRYEEEMVYGQSANY